MIIAGRIVRFQDRCRAGAADDFVLNLFYLRTGKS